MLENDEAPGRHLISRRQLRCGVNQFELMHGKLPLCQCLVQVYGVYLREEYFGVMQLNSRQLVPPVLRSDVTGPFQIHMKTMPTSLFRLLTGQESPVYI